MRVTNVRHMYYIKECYHISNLLVKLIYKLRHENTVLLRVAVFCKDHIWIRILIILYILLHNII